MKKVFAFTLTLLLAFTFALGFGSAALAQGELQNASFEEAGDNGLPANWDTYDWNQRTPADGKAATFTLLTDSGAKDGKSYMKITAPDPNDARLRGQMKVESKTKYKISAWAKTEGVPEDAKCGANISLDGSTVTSLDIKGTSTEWKELVYYFDSATFDKITVTLGIGGYFKSSKGTVYFDDVKVEKVTEVPAGAVFFVAGSNNPAPAASTTSTNGSGMNPVVIIVIAIVALIIIGGIVYFFYMKSKAAILNEEPKNELNEEADEEPREDLDDKVEEAKDDEDDEDSML